jgi:hypothetical protein
MNTPFILIGPQRRNAINLAHIVEAEWQGSDLVLVTTAQAVDEHAPHVIVLFGDDAERVWEGITENTKRHPSLA